MENKVIQKTGADKGMEVAMQQVITPDSMEKILS
jgi:hypothetical protein